MLKAETNIPQPPTMTFTFNDSHPIRIVARDGAPWFVAPDVCAALGLQNTAQAVAVLDADEKGVCLTYTPGGKQRTTLVSEGGLYTLILRSRAATTPGTAAHRFRKWVTAELLPSVRKKLYGDPANAPIAEAPAERARPRRIARRQPLLERQRQLARMADSMEIDMLPFVCVAKGAGRRNFWAPRSTGDYAFDCSLGKRYGEALLSLLLKPEGGRLLSSIVMGIAARGRKDRDAGVIVGMMHVIGAHLANSAA